MCVEWDTFWSAVSAIATAIGAGAIWFAVRQIRFEAWLKAQEIWTAQEFTQARDRVFTRLDTGSNEWRATEEAEALEVCRKMDEFAGLIPYLPRRIALRFWGVPFAKAWLILEPIVQKERDKCAWPDKWNAFRRLGQAALKSHPEVQKNQSASGR